MRYGEVLRAQSAGHELLAQIAGLEIPVVVSAVSTRIRLEFDRAKGMNQPVGDAYFSVECRDARGNGVYHVAPELLRERDERVREDIDEMERRANHE